MKLEDLDNNFIYLIEAMLEGYAEAKVDKEKAVSLILHYVAALDIGNLNELNYLIENVQSTADARKLWIDD